MEYILIYFFVYIIEAFIFLLYCNNVLNTRHTLKLNKYLSIFIGYCLIFGFSLFRNMFLNFASFLLFNIILIFIIYETTLFTSSFHALFLTSVMGICELITDSAITHLAHDFFTVSMYDIVNLSLFGAISKLLYFIIVLLISSLISKNKEQISSTTIGEIFLFIIPFISAFIMMSFFIFCYQLDFPPYIGRLISICAFLILIINICVFGFYKYSKNKQKSFYELKLKLQKESDINMYNKMLLSQNEKHQILIHDIKKHLTSLAYLNTSKEYDKIDEYIGNILESYNLIENVRVCDNNFLNAIISRYMIEAKEDNISFYTDIRSKCIDFMSEEDMTALFCNLLDNAIESAKKVEKGFINFSVVRKENTPAIFIKIINSCKTSPFSNKTGKLFTTKLNPYIHGFGVKSINQVIEKYSGSMAMHYEEEDNTFHTIITLVGGEG